MGLKSADFRLISCQKYIKTFWYKKSPMILPKFSQKLAGFRPDFCRFCRFLLPRQTAKALYTFAAAIAAASGMYSFKTHLAVHRFVHFYCSVMAWIFFCQRIELWRRKVQPWFFYLLVVRLIWGLRVTQKKVSLCLKFEVWSNNWTKKNCSEIFLVVQYSIEGEREKNNASLVPFL